MNNKESVSILLPCHNEEGAISFCLEQLEEVINNNSLDAEIIIIDNKSTDKTIEIVENNKSRFSDLKIITEDNIGYGYAYLRGLAEAKKENIFMADADGSYDFNEIPNFINKLNKGYDVVIGNRFSKKMKDGAMPHIHKYIGNPILSFITRLLFKIKIKDIHCGARAIKKEGYDKLNLQTTGMEFASEMIILSSKNKLKMAELPITYHKRIGNSKLKSFRDGWRHLRFILLNSPLTLFLLPGLFLFILGIALSGILYFTNPVLGNIQLYFHPMFITAIMLLVGYQLIFFAIFAKTYAVINLNEEEKKLEKLFKYITIEKAGIIGIIFTLIGLLIFVYVFKTWINLDFQSFNQVKNSIASLIFIVLGIQTVSSAFMLSILSIKQK